MRTENPRIESGMKLSDFIPPLLHSALRTRPPSHLPEYDSFASALEDSDTYEDSGIIEVVSRKTQAYRKSLNSGSVSIGNRQTVQNMFVISYLESCHEPVSVLELGGACGATYFELDHLLPGKIRSWAIVETAPMAAAGKKLFQNGKLAFFDDLDAAAQLKKFDLVAAQGVLQYCSNPLQTFDSLLELDSRYIYVTRTVVNAGDTGEKPIITKQITQLAAHGPGPLPVGMTDRKSTQPLTLVPYESISSRISISRRILFRFEEGESSSLVVGSRAVTTKTVGFLAASKRDTMK